MNEERKSPRAKWRDVIETLFYAVGWSAVIHAVGQYMKGDIQEAIFELLLVVTAVIGLSGIVLIDFTKNKQIEK